VERRGGDREGDEGGGKAGGIGKIKNYPGPAIWAWATGVIRISGNQQARR
jgi:hypothetical protein